MGKKNVQKTLNRYYDDWKFRHPGPNDFIRIAEKVSGAELDWYLQDWTQTTNTIDYAIQTVEDTGSQTEVTLQRLGVMPMPVEVSVTYKDGSEELIYIPLQMMRWEKPAENGNNRTVKEDWAWAMPSYTFSIDRSKSDISKIEIDDSHLMADVDRENNVYEAPETAKE